MFVFKCTFFTNDGYFNNYLNFTNEMSQNTRSSQYLVPSMQVKSFWGRNTFQYNGVLEWISLPDNICKNVGNMNYFKK